MRDLRRHELMQQLRMDRAMRPPTTQATGMTMLRWLWIQSMPRQTQLAPEQTPFWQVPPPSQGVPSRKYCCML